MFELDDNGILILLSADCDICHKPDSLRISCYKIDNDGESQAVCGDCYRMIKYQEGKSAQDCNLNDSGESPHVY